MFFSPAFVAYPTVAAAPAPGGGFLNGFGFRRWLRVSGDALGGIAAQALLPLWFDETLPSLKSVANGGNVKSTAGWDIRFEVAGQKIAHELEIYDPTTGRAAGWLDCSALTPGTNLDVAMFYGKTVTAAEQDPATLWGGYLGVWRMPDGNDMLGAGRHLVPSTVATGTTAPGTGTILGMPAGTLTATAAYKKADASYLNGVTQFATAVWHNPTSTASSGMMFRIGAGPGNAAHAFWRDHSFLDGAGITHTDEYAGSAKFTTGNPNEYGSDGSVTLEPSLIGINLVVGAEPQVFKNGVKLASVLGGAVGTGTMPVTSAMDITLGQNAGNNASAAAGAYGRIMVLPAAVDQNWWAFCYQNVLAPHAVYGISDEDAAADTDNSPLLAPVRGQVSAGAAVSVNILARASDPDGGTMLAGLAAPTPSLGTAAVVANAITYTAGATPGTDRLGITATQGTKSAKALLTMAVGPGSGGGGGAGELPVAPNVSTYWQSVKLSTGAGTITQDATDIRLTGGTVGDSTQAVGIVSIKRPDVTTPQGMFTAPYTLEFDYTPLDNNTDPGGVFCQLYLVRRAGSNANFGSLDGNYSPTDSSLGAPAPGGEGASGLRFSFDIKGGNGDAIRGRANDASFGDSATLHYASANFALKSGETAQTFAFPRNKVTHLAWNFPGDDTVSVTATWPAGTTPATTTQNFQDPLIQTWLGTNARNFLLTAYAGRDCKIANVVWTDGSGGGGGPPPPGPVGGGASTEGLAPPIPAIDASKVVYTDAAGLQTAYNGLPANPAGWTIILKPQVNASPTGPWTFAKSGAAGAPIVIRAGTWDGSTFTEPASMPDAAHLNATCNLNGKVDVTGAYHLFRGIRFTAFTTAFGNNNRFNCCLFDGAGNAVDNADGTMWDWCEFANFNNVALHQLPEKGCKNAIAYRCYFHNQVSQVNNSGTYHMIGNSSQSSMSASGVPRFSNIVTLDCLYVGTGSSSVHETATESWETKGSNTQCLRSSTVGTFYYVDASNVVHTGNLFFNIRHGYENRVIACTGNRVEMRGGEHIISDCSMSSGALDPETGDITFTAWANASYTDSATHNLYPNAENIDIVRCDGASIGLGRGQSHHANYPYVTPSGTTLWSCSNVGSVTYMHGSPTAATAVGQPARLVTSFTIPGGGTWVLNRTRDLALLPWKAPTSTTDGSVGPNGTYKVSEDT